jgi:environmental stress-induced protein Ves
MQIIRKSSFRASPWNNGGGMTHEVIRVPLGTDAFRWRVSVAQIDVSGPFSDFADYHRKMVLLRGTGVRLTFSWQCRGTASPSARRRPLKSAAPLVLFATLDDNSP